MFKLILLFSFIFNVDILHGKFQVIENLEKSVEDYSIKIFHIFCKVR